MAIRWEMGTNLSSSDGKKSELYKPERGPLPHGGPFSYGHPLSRGPSTPALGAPAPCFCMGTLPTPWASPWPCVWGPYPTLSRGPLDPCCVCVGGVSFTLTVSSTTHILTTPRSLPVAGHLKSLSVKQQREGKHGLKVAGGTARPHVGPEVPCASRGVPNRACPHLHPWIWSSTFVLNFNR